MFFLIAKVLVSGWEDMMQIHEITKRQLTVAGAE